VRLDRVFLVFRKDWLEIRRNWQIMMPILVIPLIFCILLPSLILLIPESQSSSSEVGGMLALLPVEMRVAIAGFNENQIIAYLMLTFVFMPFFLIIPAMASSVISSDSFAGEKERKTIEGLLATPLTDGELIVGKMLVAFVPSMIVTLLSFVVYTALVDFLGFSLFGRFILPTVNWMLTIFLLAPAVSVAGIAVTVLVSARVKGFREAQQLSVLIILPIMSLVVGQALGVLLLVPEVIVMLFVVFAVIDVIILKVCLRVFQREEILSRIR
jgi:ABC-2 type transport system permease protein